MRDLSTYPNPMKLLSGFWSVLNIGVSNEKLVSGVEWKTHGLWVSEAGRMGWGGGDSKQKYQLTEANILRPDTILERQNHWLKL